MKLVYGTTNPSKLKHMKDILHDLDVEIIGANDLDMDYHIDECGKSPLENALIKAKTNYEISGIPTFSADSGIYIEGLEENKQPGVYVRRVDNKYLDDEAFIDYYQKVALSMGGEVKAKFKNAICFVLDKEHIYYEDSDDIADYFILTSKVHRKRRIGFPMDSLAVDIKTGKYFVEGGNLGNEERFRKGIRDFFILSLNL